MPVDEFVATQRASQCIVLSRWAMKILVEWWVADIRQSHGRLALGRCSSVGCTSYHHNARERQLLQLGLSYSGSETRNPQTHHDQHGDTLFHQMHDRPHPLVIPHHSRPTASYHILLYVHHSSLVNRSIVSLIVSWVSSKHSTRTRTCTHRPIYHFKRRRE